MALKCNCNRILPIKQSEINKKGSIIIRCGECERTYFVDLVEIDDIMKVLNNLKDVQIITK